MSFSSKASGETTSAEEEMAAGGGIAKQEVLESDFANCVGRATEEEEEEERRSGSDVFAARIGDKELPKTTRLLRGESREGEERAGARDDGRHVEKEEDEDEINGAASRKSSAESGISLGEERVARGRSRDHLSIRLGEFRLDEEELSSPDSGVGPHDDDHEEEEEEEVEKDHGRKVDGFSG